MDFSERVCSRCKIRKARRFHRWCGECGREYERGRLEDPIARERKRARQRADYAAASPEKIASLRETNRRWMRSDHGKKSHRASCKEYQSSERGLELHRQNQERRRARIAGANSTLTPDEWTACLARADGRCFYCKKKRKLTMDHVVPLSKGGAHAAYNVVAACRSCNTSKGAKIVLLV